jgi:hypothetical protein
MQEDKPCNLLGVFIPSITSDSHGILHLFITSDRDIISLLEYPIVTDTAEDLFNEIVSTRLCHMSAEHKNKYTVLFSTEDNHFAILQLLLTLPPTVMSRYSNANNVLHYLMKGQTL